MTTEHLLITFYALIVHAILIVAGESLREEIRRILAQPPLRILEPQEVWIDAFDEKICGAVESRPCQSTQSALGCTDGVRADQDRLDQVVDTPSEVAGLEKFPFFVHFRVNGTKEIFNHKAYKYCPFHHSPPIACDGTEQLDEFGTCVEGSFICLKDLHREIYYESVPHAKECDGLLVDKNIVITHDECLKARVDTIKLEFGTNPVTMSNPIRDVLVVRGARKWCWQHRDLTSDGASSRLAAIELDEPIDYVEGRIWPACLRTDKAQHSNDTVCASVLTCPAEPLKSVAVMLEGPDPRVTNSVNYRKIDSHIMWEQCHSGGPIVCYDKSSKKKRVHIQAVAVGINRDYSFNDAGLSRTVDLDKARGDLYNLLLMMQKGVKRHRQLRCSNAAVKDGNESGQPGLVRKVE